MERSFRRCIRPLQDRICYVSEPEGEKPEPIDWGDRRAMERMSREAEARKNAGKKFDEEMGIRRDGEGNITSITIIPRSD